MVLRSKGDASVCAGGRFLPNLGLLVAFLGLGTAFSEVTLRLVLGPPPTWSLPQESYLPDQEIGHWLEPKQQSFTHGEIVEVNSLGLRDREYSRQRPPGTRRLLALGDSQTFGNGVALYDTWPKQLELVLRARERSTKWEVINAGLPGSDTWQHERMLSRLVQAYTVDAAILAHYVNDVVRAPEATGTRDSAFVRTNTWSNRMGYWLKRSSLLLAVWQARAPFRSWVSPQNSPWEERILTGDPDPRVEAGWTQVTHSLAEMKRVSEERGIGFWVAVLPRRDQVSGKQPGREYQRRLKAITADLGVPIIDILPALREAWATERDALFIPWDGHNSALANTVIARLVADSLVEAEARMVDQR